MKESDYILAANLAKLRVAHNAIADCLFIDENGDTAQRKICRSMSLLIARLERQVDERVETDE